LPKIYNYDILKKLDFYCETSGVLGIRFAFCYIAYYNQCRGALMAAKIKPIEPTVIKDKRIVREVVAQVRRKPTAEDIKWPKARRKFYNELTAK